MDATVVEVHPADLRAAADRVDRAADTTSTAARTVLGLALGASDVGPDGAELAAAVARLLDRVGAQLSSVCTATRADADALRCAAADYTSTDADLAARLQALARS